ncbi:hypothetical protein HZS_704 [Henneguya salminicola]|nr:hypothetical protein HZS_704 [Henneguya salminicola]
MKENVLVKTYRRIQCLLVFLIIILIGHYTVQQKSYSSDKFEQFDELGIDVHIQQEGGNNILTRFYAKSGRFSIRSDHDGSSYVVCVTAKSSIPTELKKQLHPQIMIKLDFTTGDHDVDQKALDDKKKMGSLEHHIKDLIEQTDQIIKEQGLQKKREEVFRSISSSTSNRVLCWAAFQILLLIFASVWQIHHLRKFFHSKKLV